ncbi:hypothetical protein QYM36_011433 [Artemia franciscana]|uniref:Endonuclease/exonuclease/phosphatase domain-containing protein n=1 Tax=Artemia franciscana TaxID=6661 RepID=A0AA88L4U0_ARTSF|nr:hypothetical protein QYM36_011433 [Artemia franciscana]
MERYKIDTLCLSETRMCGSSTKVITAADSFQQFYLFYSGVESNSVLHEWEQISPRLAKIRFKGSPASISLLSAYAPTRDALDETKNDFYTELQTVTSAIATRDFLIVAGDFNARMRPKDQITSKVIGRGCIDNIFGARLIIQHFQRYNLPLALIFLEDTAALDSVTHHKLWKTLEINETPVKFIELIQAYYSESTSRIRIYGKEPEEFLVESTSLIDIDYADDVEILSDPEHDQKMLDDIVEWSNLIRLKVSREKTKFMTMNHPTQISLSVNKTQLVRVEFFT